MADRRTELLYKLRASEITPPEAVELDGILEEDKKVAEERGDELSAAVLSLGKIVLTPYILKAERAKAKKRRWWSRLLHLMVI